MANMNIVIKIAAQDNASGTIGKIKSALGGLGSTAGSVATIAGGVLVAGLGAGAVVGLSFNNSMEQVTAQLNAFTKDGAKTADILEMIKDRAAKTPFEFEEMAQATTALYPAATQSGLALEDLVSQAEILAASNPAQGLEGAAFALKEAVSGDFTSIIERFNLPRQYLNQLKAEGVPAAQAVSMAMQQLGLDSSLVSNMAETAQGRWSTLQDTFTNLAGTVTQPIFDAFSNGLGVVNKYLADNEPLLTGMANTLAGGLTTAIEKVQTAWGLMNQVFSGDNSSGDLLVSNFGKVGSVLEYIADGARRVVDAFKNGGIGGAITEFGAVISEGLGTAWETTIKPKLLEWGGQFWGWLTGPEGAMSTLSGTFTTVISAISQFITTNWPTIQTALTEWSNKFWDWVLGPGGALEKTSSALDGIMLKVQTWVTTNQPLLQAEGVKIGGYMMDALNVLFNDQEKTNKVVGTLLGSIGRAVISMASTSNKAGADIGSGIVKGMVDYLAGSKASSPIVKALEKLVEIVLDAFNPIGQITKGISGLTSSGSSSSKKTGFASGGSFIVPGNGTGDRPYVLGLTPGELVNVIPKGGLAMAGAGSGMMTLPASTNNSTNWSVTVYANDEAGGKKAANALVETLRAKGLR